MKVLQVNTVCGTGSTGRIVMDLYKMLEEQGHQCLVAYGRGRVPPNMNAIRIGNDVDKYLHAFMTRVTDKTAFYSKYVTRKFIEQIREYKPDIIHLHNLHGYYIHVGVLFEFLKEADIPIVWTLHDCWAFTGHCSNFDYAGCERWKSQCSKCIQKTEYPKSSVKDNSIYNYNKKKDCFNGVRNLRIITPSKWLAGMVEQSYLRKYSIQVIYNGLDTAIFSPTKGNILKKCLTRDKYMILGVANVWNDRKGLQDFIDLSQRLDNTRYQIVLVGINDKQMKQVPDSIVCVSKTHDVHTLAELYTRADLYINASREETLGMTTLEAMACGTPVVVYNRTAIPEPVTKECGIVLEQLGADALYQAIMQMEQHPLRKEDCMKRAAEFGLEHMQAKYMGVYNRMKEDR